jgi:nanoRNase/pAp phosphatase (c-di-AMP/oligoRNAs hydrolase)
MNLFEYVKELTGTVLLLSHQNADLDAICSSIALKDAFSVLNQNIEILMGVPNSISKNAKSMVEESQFLINPSLDVDLLVILDSSTLEQISPLDKDIDMAKKIAIIDHHVPHEETKNISDFYLVDEGAVSTAEVLYELIKAEGIELKKSSNLALLVGILADSARLRLATAKTIQIFSQLLDSGVDYQKALELVELPEDDASQKIACLKAAKRMEIHKVDDWVLVTTKVNSFEARAANCIISIGADCVFVGSTDKEKIKMSARARENFLKDTGISLGKDIMPHVGEFVGGSGGGHREAAGVKSKSGDLDAALSECIKVTGEIIKQSKE